MKAKHNKLIAEKLYNHTLELVQSTGLDYMVLNENSQVGNGFGEKLVNAFQDVFDVGYNNVMAIGADCPQLTKEQLVNAQQKLHSGQAVLGPSKDGGAYLIGISSNNFEQEDWIKLPWESCSLYEEMMGLIEDHSAIVELTTLIDIDHFKDLQKVAFFIQSNIIRFLYSLVHNIKIGLQLSCFVLDLPKVSKHGLRAPPANMI